MNTFIFCDLDGSLSNDSHRRDLIPLHWADYANYHKACVRDQINYNVVRKIEELRGARSDSTGLVLFSGRPEHYRNQTRHWVLKTGLSVTRIMLRPKGNLLPQPTLKRWHIEQFFKQPLPQIKDRVLAVIDNEERVLHEFRRLGIPTYQVQGNAEVLQR